ncbi:Uncharacterized protein HZ326_3521 [Fusarium oxysporum f. sp. albedinis]|nr:Uncharacterized protein HZ326_3521 [Fusarium oxysporum f. sp. albedinis]
MGVLRCHKSHLACRNQNANQNPKDQHKNASKNLAAVIFISYGSLAQPASTHPLIPNLTRHWSTIGQLT